MPGRPPLAVRLAVLLNVVAAVGVSAFLLSGGLGYLEPGFPPGWQVALAGIAWVAGAVGLWRGRRWGWYVAVAAAALGACFISFVGYMLLFFHGAPTLARVANIEALATIVLTLLPWGVVGSLLGPHIRRHAFGLKADGSRSE